MVSKKTVTPKTKKSTVASKKIIRSRSKSPSTTRSRLSSEIKSKTKSLKAYVAKVDKKKVAKGAVGTAGLLAALLAAKKYHTNRAVYNDLRSPYDSSTPSYERYLAERAKRVPRAALDTGKGYSKTAMEKLRALFKRKD